MKRLELVVENGTLSGQHFSVKEGGLRLGRSSSNDICIPDEELSRNHCLFEVDGDAGVSVTDLASANGTYVNGESIGARSVRLKAGDQISVGETSLKVVSPDAPNVGVAERGKSAAVDLGLNHNSGESKGEGKNGFSGFKAPEVKRRSPVANLLWAFTVCLLLAAIGLILFDKQNQQKAVVTPIDDVKDDIIEMRYEKVEADSDSIFRYYMVYAPDGTLKVMIDDVPGENRHIVRSAKLGDKARARLVEILTDPEVKTLDREYVGPDGEPPELKSWTLQIVYTTRSKLIRIINTQEPDTFKRLREKLEAFSKNELGIWAIQYSRDKLEELARKSAETARIKWEDRDVEYGNIFAAISAYKEAIFYLETVNPKPNDYGVYKAALEMAERELEARYKEQRFKADKAINLKDWIVAQDELKILCELVPDREDERYREAAAKLVDVEKRLGKTKGGK